jgi:hypothetical protein
MAGRFRGNAIHAGAGFRNGSTPLIGPLNGYPPFTLLGGLGFQNGPGGDVRLGYLLEVTAATRVSLALSRPRARVSPREPRASQIWNWGTSPLPAPLALVLTSGARPSALSREPACRKGGTPTLPNSYTDL